MNKIGVSAPTRALVLPLKRQPGQIAPAALNPRTSMKNDKPRKTYRISPLRRGFFSGVWVLFSLLLLVLSFFENDPTSQSALYITAGIVLAIGAAMTPLVWYTRLKVAPDGIELRQFGWRARVAWDNVAEVVQESRAFGLILKQPMNKVADISLRVGILIPGWYSSEQADLVMKGLWLPLEPFAWSWNHGALRQDFQRCAPFLSIIDKPSRDSAGCCTGWHRRSDVGE